jgi:APA family basic amino acid/polyamine antiporter
MSAGDSIGRLRRILGVGFGLAVSVGGTIGIGILRTPGDVAGKLHIGSVILGFWLVGGLYNLVGANCFTELGAMFPQAGGYYVYARRAFGDWVGFAVGWTDWLTYCAVLGYVSIAIEDYLAKLAPVLDRPWHATAIVVLVGFVAMQWIGVRISSWFQEWATALKFLVFLALCIAAIAMSGGAAHPATPAPPAPDLSGVVGALQAVVISYAGWQSALYFTEEDRDPVKNLPRAMIGGVLAVVVVYLLVNLALLAILPVHELAGSKLPAADAARRIVGPSGMQIITLLALISLAPLLNAILMIGTRILFALGRDRLLWSRTADVNAGGTPGIATLATTVVAIGLIVTGTFQRLVAIVAFYLLLNYAICTLALIALRRRQPELPRPFRAWGYPASAIVFVAGTIAFLILALVGDTATALAAIGLLAAGLAIHAVRRKMSETHVSRPPKLL